jgi:hypothetical protein
MAMEVNADMLTELTDLVAKRRRILRMMEYDRSQGTASGK